MVTIDDVATIIANQLAAATGFSSAVPGGAWFDRGPDTPSGYPYVTFHVKAQPIGMCFDDVYFQRFHVDLIAYCPVGASGVNPSTVQEVLNAALVTETANATLQDVSIRNASERILHSRPIAPSGHYAQQLRDGRDVFACGLTIEILVQGDRSLS